MAHSIGLHAAKFSTTLQKRNEPARHLFKGLTFSCPLSPSCFDAPSMKALVKKKAEPGLWLEDVPEPEMGPRDVLIRIRKTSICGTDVHIWKWDSWAQKTIPLSMVVGHEFCGVVEAVGSAVTDIQPGEIVSGEGHIVCGRCRNCLAGRRHLCPHTQESVSIVPVLSPNTFRFPTPMSIGWIPVFRKKSFPPSILSETPCTPR